MTDPIDNYRDGSMLHICRIYKPDIVYFLFSKEVIEYHKKDNRYYYCLEKLGELINHKFDIRSFEYEDLVDVHMFDTVYQCIKKDLLYIQSEMEPGDKLIVNVSSGTPAMKYCLQVISALKDYNFTPVIVSTPVKKSNPHKYDKNDYNPDVEWECNEDNTDFNNRCSKNFSMYMLKEIYDSNITKLVYNYDYSGAYMLADSIKNYSEDFKNLLKACQYRLQLDYSKGQSKLQSYGFTFPYTDSRKEVFEYTLSLGVKLERKEYADFVRAITPLLTEILIKLLETKCNFKISDYTNLENKRIFWDEDKLNKTDIGKKAIKILNESYKDSFGFGEIKNDHMRNLIDGMMPNSKVAENIKKINSFEKSFRNEAAHTIFTLTEDKIKKVTGITPAEIYERILNLLSNINISTKKCADNYDVMNNFVLKKM